MRNYLFLSLFVCAVALSVACGSSSTTPTSSPDSGITSLQTTDVTVGTGTQATSGRVVTVHYTLWLYSTTASDHRGSRIESSHDLGQPFSFTLGAGQVIRGWDQGVPGMKVGGVRTLIIPPSLGYGNQANGKIPPNSTLIFDVELIDVR
ncbi:MAG TPA: FKBP-type peptidyl-prolyl cis-trans isomerase [Vicinamibacterales bacterium]